jgi:hypothetical protein
MSIIIMTKSEIINSDLLYITTYIVDTNNWLEIYLLKTYASSHTCFYFIMQTESDWGKSNIIITEFKQSISMKKYFVWLCIITEDM